MNNTHNVKQTMWTCVITVYTFCILNNMSNVAKSLRTNTQRVFNNEHARWFFTVNNTIAFVIITSTVLLILETVPEYYAQYGNLFRTAELIIVTLFAIEYALRLWSAPNPVKYAISLFGIIDFLAILPGIIFLVNPASIAYHTLGILRILRILRLLRTLRLIHLVLPPHYRSRMAKEFRNSETWINLEIYFFTLITVIIFSGTLIYLAENSIPGTIFTSIPAGIWWAIVTVTTVGYGDLIPMTVAGRFIATITMFAGLALFVLMLTVMGRALQIVLFGTPIEKSLKYKK
jgi:voltage-gated potassium channel